MASLTSCRAVAHMVARRTRHWATCACRITAVRHGAGIMAHHLIDPT
eukprot:CAMPEP_0181500004 /NCGR_PEP_ID=MMETSP1110-20121109/54980_1 /TAXON_ID=174948 /ORGANISM="Symbiodinium sp., Strain CCMP421" /LENGTH=46 /DNA_ID= /DNA_START= /DNA_END= /DNA_ORIENTATION=